MNPALRLMAVAAASSPAFDPTTISGCVLWLDASDAASITSSGGAVSQWNDKSGGGLHVTQSTAANKPTTGATTQNGLNVISFDSTDTLARTGTAICGSAASIFAVFRKTGANNSFESAPVTLTASNLARPFDAWGANRFVEGTSTSGTYTDIQASTSWHQFSWVASAGSPCTFAEYKNGASVGSGTNSSTWSITSQQLTIAGRADGVTKLTGDIAEIIIYNVALGTTDRQTVEAALKSKWGTP